MARIKPFRAIRYNQEKIKDVSGVICPPYDVISEAQQSSYHSRDPHNFIHILLGKEVNGEDKYKRSAAVFKEWIKEGILVRDERAAVYFYSQQYILKGEKKTRLGFIALMELGDKGEGQGAVGHEHTRLEPKEDRMRLLKQVKANLSPIFAIFADQKRVIQSVWQKRVQGMTPCFEVTDEEKTTHTLWRIDNPADIEEIQQKMRSAGIFIADGHHRYEVACMYRDEMRKRHPEATGEEGFNYILTYFTNIESRGLTILPIHRFVRTGALFDADAFRLSVQDHFDVQEVKDKARFFFLLEKAGNTEHIIGMYGHRRYWLLRLKNVKTLDAMIANKPKVYRLLDVSILNHLIITGALHIRDKERVSFIHDPEELIERVNLDPASAAFFLNPVKVQQIMSVALSGEKMPPKSTFFYPKVASGFAVHTFD